mgnify:CR=1 FL=1|jgi:hypothetical protein
MKRHDRLWVKLPWIEAEGSGWGVLGLVALGVMALVGHLVLH